MLSKSRFTRGINCPRSLWLFLNKRDEQVIPEATQAIFARGTSAGELARQYFPGGVLALGEDELPGYNAAKRTRELIQQGVETIYEATFIYDNTLVAVDILHKHHGKWQLYEVKSTNSVKPEHIKDVAIQYYVAKGSGLEVEDVFLMHFNRDYVRRGDIVVRDLFLPESIRSGVLDFQEEIKTKIPELLDMIKGAEPDTAMGLQCTKPYYCDFYEYCSGLLPVAGEASEELSSIPEVMADDLKAFMEGLQYPLYYLDFETIMPGVPLFDESRPYQQLTFQYSLHHQDVQGGELKHDFYLAENDFSLDPRKALIEQLIEQTKPAKTILVYHIVFERTRLSEMQRDFPQYEKELQHIIDRLEDLIIPFKRDFYRTGTMNGSSSLKQVLPALCPELSYDDLEIGDGMAASNAFLDLYYTDDDELKRQMRENLLKYCHRDTLAMVKILEILYRCVNKK
ncbi:MAG TPA: DUF2779 domain-containing protein [Bacteroidales bacterium]|nr:DUF2779 domain-containing protein [Bacteroidales bacterium]